MSEDIIGRRERARCAVERLEWRLARMREGVSDVDRRRMWRTHPLIRSLRAALASARLELRRLEAAAAGDEQRAARARQRRELGERLRQPAANTWRARVTISGAAVRAWLAEQRAATRAAQWMQQRGAERIGVHCSRRDAIRRAAPCERRGPPEPDRLTLLLDQLVSVTVALREQLAATSPTQADDRWISQRETPLPPRVHCRAARDGLASGDVRCARRGRLWFLRASLVDELVRGIPRAAGDALVSDDPSPAPLSAVERVKRRLAAMEAAEGIRNGGAS